MDAPKLSDSESKLLELLLLMTGREDRLQRTPLVNPDLVAGIKAVAPVLTKVDNRELPSETRCELLNRLRSSLAIKPISLATFQVVFGDADFSKLSDVENQIERFRTHCMLHYGSFRFGFKQFRTGGRVQELWHQHFPTTPEIQTRAQNFKSRMKPIGLIQIPASQLFSLGYLAAEHAARLNPARKQLEDLIKKAISENAANFEDLCKASGKKAGEVPPIIAAAGIPGSEALFYQDLPIFSQAKSYTEILQIIRDLCAKVDDEAITKARQDGLQNARTYMSMRDLDVYVATSMRDPLHFTTNWDFVNGLFHRGALAEWSIRYFDPTQSFLEDRVQKGLLEYLMIKRARLCVYNAQESDTFGKDAEAGVTLAQGKPVVVYVARLFPSIDRLKSVYEAIDEGTRHGRDAFLDLLRKSALLSEDQIGILRDPDKTTPDAINELLRKHVPAVLEKLSADVIEMELIRQGYDPTGPADPKDQP